MSRHYCLLSKIKIDVLVSEQAIDIRQVYNNQPKELMFAPGGKSVVDIDVDVR